MPCGICHVEDYYAMSYKSSPLAKVSKSKNKVIVWYTGIVYLFFTPKNKFRIFLKLKSESTYRTTNTKGREVNTYDYEF